MDKELIWRMMEMEQRRAYEKRMRRFDPHRPGRFVKRESQNAFIRSTAIRVDKLADGVELWVTYSPLREGELRMRELYAELKFAGIDPDALNGYIAFPKRRAPRIPRNDTGNIAQYIPVHGGITYAAKDSTAAVWGFDTQHAGSEHTDRTNPEWIVYNCLVMHHCLVHAGKLWPEWKRANREKRIAIAERLQASVAVGELGFGALISALCGRVG